MTNEGVVNLRSTIESSESFVHTMINSYMLSASLFTCVEFDIFSFLSANHGVSIHDLASRCSLDVEQLQKIVSFCRAVGLIFEKNELLFNSKVAEKLLSRNSCDTNVIDAVLHHKNHIYPLFSYLNESLSLNEPVVSKLGCFEGHAVNGEFYSDIANNDKELEICMGAMNIFSRGSGSLVADCINDLPIREPKILDLGGGGGQVAIEIASVIPDAEIILVDIPKVVDLTRKIVSKSQIRGNIECLSADFFSPLPLPPDAYDIVVLSSLLGDWGREAQDKLLSNAYLHLKEGGLLIVCETLLDNNLSGPILPTLMSLYVQVLTHGGENFTEHKLLQLLENHLFHDITVSINRLCGCRDIITARK